MADPSEADVRTTIRISDVQVLTSAEVTLAISDAKSITGQTDEIALRYYTCYIIALNWDNLKRTTAIEGVVFDVPVPDNFLKSYEKRVDQVNADAGNDIGIIKLSTNPGFSYDQQKNYIRPRRDGDPYY